MGNVSENLSIAAAAVNSIAPILAPNGVQDIYLFGPRATGKDKPGDNWDFMIDFARPVSRREFLTVYNALGAAVKEQAGPLAGFYVTSPQYDRPSFTAWAVKSSALLFSAP